MASALLGSLMKVEKVPDSTYDMIGGLDQQIKEIKEVGWRLASPRQLWLFTCYCVHTMLCTRG